MKYDLRSQFQRDKATARLVKLCEKASSTVEIREVGKPRTLSQNRYYFALLNIFGCEVGYTKDELHVDMKRAYGLVYEKNGRKYLKSTTALSTKEMTDYIEFIRNKAGQMGIHLPDADELQREWAYYENLISNHKQHTGEQS